MVASALMFEDDDGDDVDEEGSKPKKKVRRVLTLEEDPLQYHAKPRDLSQRGALLAPHELNNETISSHIFSRSPFSSLPLDRKRQST